MAIYEYYCPTCRTRFEQRRPMAHAAVAVMCDQGHTAERTISAFSTPRGEPGPFAFDDPGAGGCCGGGGGCACRN